MSIGAKSVLGQECTISAFQHVSIGRECIVADRVMMIDFDHGVVEVERPIREQGIYKRDVNVGHNVWIGYGACLLRGVTVGDNSVIGTSSVVTCDVEANSVVGGVPGPPDPRARRAHDVPLGVSSQPPGRYPSQPDRSGRQARAAPARAPGRRPGPARARPDAPPRAPAGSRRRARAVTRNAQSLDCSASSSRSARSLACSRAAATRELGPPRLPGQVRDRGAAPGPQVAALAPAS